MCGIAAIVDLTRSRRLRLERGLAVMNDLQRHRGPDGAGLWLHPGGFAGLAHRRLSILGSASGVQPMVDARGTVVSHNGEIYNYQDLGAGLSPPCTGAVSDTEVLLRAYGARGLACLPSLRGMFAFALWDEQEGSLVCVRDRLGIKPLYYTVVDEALYVASEIKALLPFLPSIETDPVGFEQYQAFQFCVGDRTLFKGVWQVRPGHCLTARPGQLRVEPYWTLPAPASEAWPGSGDPVAMVRTGIEESVALHLVGTGPLGAAVSGGLDSSVVAVEARRRLAESGREFAGFVGAFPDDPECDERAFAKEVAAHGTFPLHQVLIREHDFVEHMQRVIYHLDVPVAGPGALPQFMVSRAAAASRRVLLGGQGGDELFGGYVRYVAVASECGLADLSAFGDYAPMLRRLRDAGGSDVASRYFSLIDRRSQVPSGHDRVRETFMELFAPYASTAAGVHSPEQAFDQMMRFDLQTSLPALLHVEDRMSMAHGLESRVPLLDHRLVERVAQLPAACRYARGRLKAVLRDAMHHALPASIARRQDKMGFPVPLQRWLATAGPVHEWTRALLGSPRARQRALADHEAVTTGAKTDTTFGRAAWSQISLELWHQTFHDRGAEFRRRLSE